MEKPIDQFQQQQEQEQQQQQQEQQQRQQPREALKCPRCNSSNTKFCYYNNYSLSQPRHFCKACKRYWTRGGTLRNVPVGGGCRKNKRSVKKPITTTPQHVLVNTSLLNPQITNPNPNTNLLDHNPNIPSSTTSNSTTNHNHHLNPLFYGLIPQNPNYPRFDSDNPRVSGYDLLQPHMNASGLVFGSSLVANHGHNSNLSFTSYMNSSVYGGGGSTSSSTSAAPTMASLLASSLSQQQRFLGFASTNYDGGSVVKDPNYHDQIKNDNQIEAVASTDLNSMLWDSEGGGWLDPVNNIGSSVPSLI